MKIIIPIASTDKEIVENFSTIKPLVMLGDRTMIETFIYNFQFDYEYIFLCKKKDLIETNLLKTIQNLKIKKTIVSINKDTSSVIETVYFAKKFVDVNEEVLICHPDNINVFSKKDFQEKLKKNNSIGLAIFIKSY